MSKFARRIEVVGAHAEGEVGRVIVGGVAPPPGDTLHDQRVWLRDHGDGLRKMLLFEPRGGAFTHANLLVPPLSKEADAAFIIMEPDDYPPMSGSNCICVTTVLLETGRIEMKEPETRLTLETPGGLVRVVAACADGKCRRVRFANVASFAPLLDRTITVDGLGEVRCDISYGGAFFILVDADEFGFKLVAEEARALVELGERIKAAAAAQITIAHPDNADINALAFTQFTGPLRRQAGRTIARNAVVISPGKIDRSPCGTGTSARLAVLQARGILGEGDPYVNESLIGSRFDAGIEALTTVGPYPAIVPWVSGRAWITGFHDYVLDPDDPFPEGYTLSDTWYRTL